MDLLEKYNNKIIDMPYKDEAFRIVGACMEVHNELGKGFSEIVYKDALQIEFARNEIAFEREKKYEVYYKEVKLNHSFFADFVLLDKIVLEIKAQPNGLGDENYKQILNYLAVSGCKLGLLVNFSESSLKYKRVVL